MIKATARADMEDASADAEFRQWAEALPDPRVTELLLSMRYAEESERVDQGFEGLRLLDELNAHVGRLMVVLGIGSSEDDAGGDPVGVWLQQHKEEEQQQQQLRPPLSTFGAGVTDPYGSLEQLAALEQLEREVLDMLDDEPDDSSDLK